MQTMQDRWIILWTALGAGEMAGNLYPRIVDAYTEPQRAYHNIHHIKHCLHEFDQVKKRLANPQEVELAIWFHDVVYDPRAVDNEEKSARFAATQLKNAEVTGLQIDRVKQLILDTRHNRPVNTSDGKYLVDIDISSLGYPPGIYHEYESDIRKEYAWVPEAIYREKRIEILSSFLNRHPIYFTRYFSNKYERQARSNLKKAIALLRA